MEFEDQEVENDGEGDIEMGPSYDSLGNSNSTRPSPLAAAIMVPHEPPPQALRRPKYKECLKNHAVGIGANAIDGCGEFLPAGAEGTLDALKCAACNCHRNFHRKESGGATGAHQQLLTYHHPQHGGQFSPFYRTPSGYLHVAAPQQPRPLALPSTSGGGGSREEQEDMNSGGGMSSKKRNRTKFTQEQKEKMLELAEKMGWRFQKQDEEMVQNLCNELGIRRHVLKVWMHNNKNTLGKKP